MAQDYSYIGIGKAYLRELGAAAGLLELGNASALNFAVTEDTKELKDYTQPGGGTYNEVRRISAVEMSASVHDLSPTNIARSLYGAVTAVTSAAVTGEEHTGYKGAFVSLASLPSAAPAWVVKAKNGDTAAARANTTTVTLGAYLKPATDNGFFYEVTTAGTTGASVPTFPTTVGATVTDGSAVLTCRGRITLTAGTDYEVRPSGFLIATDAAFTDGQVLTVGYTKAAADVVQALVNSGKEYELVFDGLNEARSGKRVRVTAYRIKAGALANLALIGEDYGVAEITGKLLKDTAKTGAGVSQYFKVEFEA